jgi:fucose permease
LALLVIAMTIVVWVFIKEDPNQSTNQSTLANNTNKQGVSFRQAVKNRTFAILSTIFFLLALAVSGMIIHFIPMLLNLGVSANQAGKIAAVLSVSLMAGRLVTGFLIDRFYAPRVAAILFGLSSIGLTMFLIGGVQFALVAAVAIGITMGAEVDLIGYLVSRYFGLKA